MKAIIPFLVVMVAITVSMVAEETKRTVDTELRDSAKVGNRLAWNNGFMRDVTLHQIYICKVIQPPDSIQNGTRWQLQIDRTIRGERTGEIACRLPGETNEVKAGTRLIILGNDHKTGFSVIGWWFYSEKTEKAIEDLAKPIAAGYSHPARIPEP